uniref:Myb-like domain-containing protein n=1 Tax=Davidia involucrata TaxID=16924 RepID=A0A5B7BDM4_DAVIN
MANPSGTNHESAQPTHGSASLNGPINGNSVPALENSGTAPSLKHNPGISTDWTVEEQLILEEGLTTYASESSIIRYAKIAMKLQNKTVRDVALRCRWLTKKENSKRRKEEHKLTRKSRDKKEKITEPSAKSCHVAVQPGFPPYAQQMITMESDDGISYKAIGGATGQLLEQNAQYFDKISSNFTAHQVHENISLLCQARDNILKILNTLSDMPDIMKQMPPLPVKVNEELANSILPRSVVPMQS